MHAAGKDEFMDWRFLREAINSCIDEQPLLYHAGAGVARVFTATINLAEIDQLGWPLGHGVIVAMRRYKKGDGLAAIWDTFPGDISHEDYRQQSVFWGTWLGMVNLQSLG
ncbi:hypothetical protein BJY04DRAFT_197002 [Aspergillus karnatakaensis]|uniref:uncharacterized protein n=1 Tax=Aspergillus karnatakaensis TaxID=1810916 RepID=UPI003CCDE0AE